MATNKLKRYRIEHDTDIWGICVDELPNGDWVRWEEVKKYLDDLSGLLFVAQATENWEDVRNTIGQIVVDTSEHEERNEMK